MCNTLINVESEKNIPIEIELDGIIDISDSEDELPPSERRFNRSLPGQRCDENWSNLKEDSPLSSTRKRKWVSATGSSEQGIEEDIIMKKFNAHKDENPKRFSLTMCSRIPNASFGGQHVEENKSSTEGETLDHLQTSGSLHEKVGNTCMGDTENVLEDVRSNGESENYGAHVVKGDLHLDDNQIKLIQGNQSNWKFGADMLSSFEEDPEISMKAVCALCRQQTLQEKSEQDPLGYNAKRGFGAFYVISPCLHFLSKSYLFALYVFVFQASYFGVRIFSYPAAPFLIYLRLNTIDGPGELK
ncbi:uncharacterized protein LOC113302396 isoform X3 [Papaver somniferum]|uniref:uncharacterized protein LOC113302396 isoform X3 n=1 Tax=Papaver somniferum TaxID=3469 RepID=UPI000E6FBAF0|nr:uncharacterized protein LOC113302396 isoform X3 [Papaver somniferum]